MGSENSKSLNTQDWDNFIEKSTQNHEKVYGDPQTQLEKFKNDEYSEKTKIIQQQLQKIAINSYIKDELTSEPSSTKSNVFEIKGQIISKQKHSFTISIFFWAIEEVDKQGKFNKISFEKKLNDINVPETEKFELNFELDLNNVNMKKFKSDYTFENYPLLITINEKIISAYVFTLNKNELFKPVLIRKGFIVNGMYLKMQQVYGLKTSSVNTENQTEKCLICFDNDKNTIIQPCNHLCLCDTCAKELKKNTEICPICRQKFENFTKIELKKNQLNF